MAVLHKLRHPQRHSALLSRLFLAIETISGAHIFPPLFLFSSLVLPPSPYAPYGSYRAPFIYMNIGVSLIYSFIYARRSLCCSCCCALYICAVTSISLVFIRSLRLLLFSLLYIFIFVYIYFLSPL